MTDSIMNGELPAPEGFVGSANSNSRYSPQAIERRARMRRQVEGNYVLGSRGLREDEEVVTVHRDADGRTIATEYGHGRDLVAEAKLGFAAQGNPVADDDIGTFDRDGDRDQEDRDNNAVSQTVAKLDSGPTVGRAMTDRRPA